jgi:hypothetical protein
LAVRTRLRHLDGDDASTGAFDLVELVVDGGEDVVESFDLAEPPALVRFVELLDEPMAGPLSRFGCFVGSGEFALLAGVLVDTVGAVGAHAVADGDLALGEVLFEVVPFVVGDGAVFVAGS